MKTIKVLGSGCCSCESTVKVFKDVIAENNIDATVEKIEDIQAIMEYDVMSTPGIVIDEKVVMTGKTPSKQEAKALLVDNFAETACCSDDATSCCDTTDEACCSDDNTECCSEEEKTSGCC